MKAETIRKMWQSGFVNRWHTHPDPRLRNAQDTTAAHSQRVATLYLMLTRSAACPSTFRTVLRALWHDAPECATGDVPCMAKKKGSLMTRALEWQERAFWESVGIGAPTKADPLLKLCDHLDAVLFVKLHAPDVLEGDGWPEQIEQDLGLARELGVNDVVWDLIR